MAINAALWSGVALAALAVRDAALAEPPAPPQPARLAAAAPVVAERLAPPPLAAFDPIAARPLFSPTRRPHATPAFSQPPPAVDPPALTLVGVVGRAGDLVALTRDAEGAVRRLAAGDAVLGWTVSTVEPRRVLLERGGEEHALGWTETGADAAASPPAAPPPRAAARRLAPSLRAVQHRSFDPDADDHDMHHDHD